MVAFLTNRKLSIAEMLSMFSSLIFSAESRSVWGLCDIKWSLSWSFFSSACGVIECSILNSGVYSCLWAVLLLTTGLASTDIAGDVLTKELYDLERFWFWFDVFRLSWSLLFLLLLSLAWSSELSSTDLRSGLPQMAQLSGLTQSGEHSCPLSS